MTVGAWNVSKDVLVIAIITNEESKKELPQLRLEARDI